MADFIVHFKCVPSSFFRPRSYCLLLLDLLHIGPSRGHYRPSTVFTLFYIKHFVIKVFFIHCLEICKARGSVACLILVIYSLSTASADDVERWVIYLKISSFTYMCLKARKESRWRQKTQNTWHVELSYDRRQATKCLSDFNGFKYFEMWIKFLLRNLWGTMPVDMSGLGKLLC